jgi:hypothetical protein
MYPGCKRCCITIMAAFRYGAYRPCSGVCGETLNSETLNSEPITILDFGKHLVVVLYTHVAKEGCGVERSVPLVLKKADFI